jgi:hypothetical protein
MIVLKDAPDITIEMPKELLSGTICLHIYGLQTNDIDLQTYGCEELSGYTKAEFKGRYFLYMHYIIQVVENKHLFENYLRTNQRHVILNNILCPFSPVILIECCPKKLKVL